MSEFNISDAMHQKKLRKLRKYKKAHTSRQQWTKVLLTQSVKRNRTKQLFYGVVDTHFQTLKVQKCNLSSLKKTVKSKRTGRLVLSA